MCYLDLCTSTSAIFYLKCNFKLFPRQYEKYFNIKSIKVKLPVALFKKKSMKLYLLLKATSQAKACQHSCMLFA